jgi:hypothetical protein
VLFSPFDYFGKQKKSGKHFFLVQSFLMKKNDTFTVKIDDDLNARLRQVSDMSGVPISAIARAAILAAVEFHDRHGFLTMPLKFQTFDVVPNQPAAYPIEEITALRAADAPQKSATL